MKIKLPAALTALLLAAAPRVALACPVCIGSSDKNAVAFAASTTLLSALPLGMIFGMAFYLRRRAKQDEQEDR